MVVILDGYAPAQEVLTELRVEVDLLKNRGISPCLALIQTIRDKQSIRVAKHKKKQAEKTGIALKIFHLPDSTQKDLIKLIDNLNRDPDIHGIFIQMPLQDKLNEFKLVSAIAPEKDVDALSPTSMGKILLGSQTFRPAGIEAVFKLLEYYKIKSEGKHWVILGSSNYLCKPLALVLMNKKISMTFCPDFGPDVISRVKSADVLCVEVFRRHIIGSDMVKDGVVIIDFGNNYENGSVYGDVDVSEKAAAVTPVPGGVGPLVIAMLLKNTVDAAWHSFYGCQV